MIDFLRALYDPLAPSLPSPNAVDYYERILSDIVYFGVAPQVYALLKDQGRLETLPYNMRVELECLYKETAGLNLFIDHELNLILEQFGNNGIEAVPLKGVPFAQRYFGHAGARPTSDIDVLVRHNDLNRAVKCLKQLGFVMEAESIPGHFHWCFHKALPYSAIPLVVELHWNILKENTSDLDIERFWHNVQPSKLRSTRKELSELDTLYLMLLHGWKHNLNSMKYIIDIVQLIHRYDGRVEFEKLYDISRKDRTWRRVAWTLRVAYACFPHLHRIQSLPKAAEGPLCWDFRSIRSTHTTRLQQYVNVAYSQYFLYDRIQDSWPALRSWLVPSVVEMSYEWGDTCRPDSYGVQLLRLYARRLSHVASTMARSRRITNNLKNTIDKTQL